MDEVSGSVNDENGLYGDAGRDIIAGSKGDEFIGGGNGKDTIKGGIGDNKIISGLVRISYLATAVIDTIYANPMYYNYEGNAVYVNCGKGAYSARLYLAEGDSTPEIEDCEIIENGYIND